MFLRTDFRQQNWAREHQSDLHLIGWVLWHEIVWTTMPLARVVRHTSREKTVERVPLSFLYLILHHFIHWSTTVKSAQQRVGVGYQLVEGIDAGARDLSPLGLLFEASKNAFLTTWTWNMTLWVVICWRFVVKRKQIQRFLKNAESFETNALTTISLHRMRLTARTNARSLHATCDLLPNDCSVRRAVGRHEVSLFGHLFDTYKVT